MCVELREEDSSESGGEVLVFSPGSSILILLDFVNNAVGTIPLPPPLSIAHLHVISGAAWLLQGTDGRLFHGQVRGGMAQREVVWTPMSQEQVASAEGMAVETCGQSDAAGRVLGMQTPAYVLAYTDKALADIDFTTAGQGLVGVGGGHSLQVHGHPRQAGDGSVSCSRPLMLVGGEAIVSARHDPAAEKTEEGGDESEPGWYLEVVDVADQSVRKVPLQPNAEPEDDVVRVERTTAAQEVPTMVCMAAMPGGKLATLEHGSQDQRDVSFVSVWTLSREGTNKELKEWKEMMGIRAGGGADDKIRLTRNWDNKREASMPKHGKAPDGKRHAGGNTWAGGTGGADTAGLGGKGGPYRLDLDDGNPIMQVSDEEKQNISAEARAAARKMAEEAYAKRLEEIGMSAFESELYDKFLGPVEREVEQLRVVLQGVEARAHEREWLTLQPHGELDDVGARDTCSRQVCCGGVLVKCAADGCSFWVWRMCTGCVLDVSWTRDGRGAARRQARLVDGAAGERLIYRRRGERPPEPGAAQVRWRDELRGGCARGLRLRVRQGVWQHFASVSACVWVFGECAPG